MVSFWYLYCHLWTYFTPFSSVSIVNFEQVNAGWAVTHSVIVVFKGVCHYTKKIFRSRISSVNVTKSAENCGFGHIYSRNS